MLKVKRTFIAKKTYFLGFLLSGVSLSLGSQIGLGKVGVNDLLLLLAFVMSVVPMNKVARREVFGYLGRNHIVFAMGAGLFLFLTIGQIIGVIYRADSNSIPQIIRSFIYIFIILPLPAIYVILMRASVFDLVKPMYCGVIISSLLNLIAFGAGLSEDVSLVGENMIGQQVALFMPISLYLLILRGSFIRKLIHFAIFLMLFAASFLSMSKGSWLGVIIAVLLFSFHLVRDLRIITFVFSVAVFIVHQGFNHEIQNFYEMELSSSDGSGSNAQRIASALSGIYIARDFPFGIGSAYEYVAYNYIQEAKMLWVPPDPHNTLSHIAASGGFGALFFYLAICQYAFYRILKSKRIDERTRLALVAMIINGVFLMQFSGEFYTQAFWWLLLGIFIVIGDDRRYESFDMKLPSQNHNLWPLK